MTNERKTIFAQLRSLGCVEFGVQWDCVSSPHCRWFAWTDRVCGVGTLRVFGRCEIDALRKLLAKARNAAKPKARE